MVDILIDLKNDRAETVKKMESMLTIVETEKRELTDAEEAEYKKCEVTLDSLDKRIARAEKVSERKSQIETVINPIRSQIEAPAIRKNVPNDEEFESLTDFMGAIIRSPYQRDARLGKLEYREQQVSLGAQGGFMVPAQFKAELLSLTPEQTRQGGNRQESSENLPW